MKELDQIVETPAEGLHRGDNDANLNKVDSALVRDELVQDLFGDALNIIGLIQCPLCFLPTNTPVTLPCGNFICVQCRPSSFVRQRITYPVAAERQHGFKCPYQDCKQEHPVADCSMDVTLAKVISSFVKELEMSVNSHSTHGMIVDSRRSEKSSLVPMDRDSLQKDIARSGRLVTAYQLARIGQLQGICDASTNDKSNRIVNGLDSQHSDSQILEKIRIRASQDLDCQVCFALLLDPITTSCGHTFCRKCLYRVIDHSRLCPSCRQTLQLPSLLSSQASNKRLALIERTLFPEDVADRTSVVAAEENSGTTESELHTPIFVCTTSFPGMPTPLHIFEPRYRLMVRRVWENGSRRFGMVLSNRHGVVQSGLGNAPFLQYGTMLQIDGMRPLPDGRSDLWTVGVSKFKILRWGIRDDYIVSAIERFDDLPIAEEEAFERLDTLGVESNLSFESDWEHLSTQALLDLGLEFISRVRATRNSWIDRLEEKVMVFGEPPHDASSFPYWIGSVLPVSSEEKYRLIASSSVRERLKISTAWMKQAEYRWACALSCRIV